MPVPYRLHELAVEDYAHAYEWYENEQAGLGEKFVAAVDKRVAQICETPSYYGYVHGDYRQATVEGFPFMVVYKFFPKHKLVFISAIHHTSRNPKTKFRKYK